MTRKARLVSLVLLSILLTTLLSMIALATEEGGEGGAGEQESTTTTVASGLEPAVDVEGTEAAPADVDWTYRYMIPTVLVLAVAIIVITAVKYFTDVVRKRYRIIE